MCGIAGILSPQGPVDRNRLLAMTDALAHRGPDGDGIFVAPDGQVGFGHRRLSIIDLSDCAAQPMASACGRYTVTYNGEIYNFRELMAELKAEGVSFRGHGDTEVMLAAIARWGLAGALRRFAGMFAFALHDAADGSVTLVRDHVGVKPLYYTTGGTLLFGSELRALLAHGTLAPEVDRDALAGLLAFGHVPAPSSIFKGVARLPAGALLHVARDGARRLEHWWRVEDAALRGLADPLTDEGTALEALSALMDQIARDYLIADVPLGLLLSGGIDSSTVAAFAARAGAAHSFSISFDDKAYDEGPQAAAVAAHLGTTHHALTASAAEARAIVPRLAALYDEPFADSSQIPTCLVAALARREVTVVLSGDGGDEVFGGYNRYLFASRHWPRMKRLPLGLRRWLKGRIQDRSPMAWDKLLGHLPGVPRLPGDKLWKVARVLDAPDIETLHRRLVTHPWNAAGLVVGAGGLPPEDPFPLPGADDLSRMICHDQLHYLPDDILTKVDRATMAVGLEARVPLLDHRMVEFGWRLAPGLKVRGGVTKLLLRRLLARHVPPALTERPKMGFAVPLADWLRGPLRDWAEALLDRARLVHEGYFEADRLRGWWEAHLAGRADHAQALWAVLMFQAWAETLPAPKPEPMP